MEKIIFKAEERKAFGKKLKKLRKEGLVPANVFGKNIKSFAIQSNYQEFERIYQKAGETGLIELNLKDQKIPVLIHAVQTDPVSGIMLHADLIQVDLKQKVTAEVPVEVVGEAPAEKQGLGTMVVQMDEIEVEALPADLPDKFEVDVSILTGEDQSILVKDIKVESKVEVKEDPEAVVVKIEKVKEEKEEVAPVTEVEEGEGEVKEGEVQESAGGEESPKEEQQEDKKE